MLKLIIGSKSYSSWSLRPWLLLKQAQIPFEELELNFAAPDFKERVRALSPSGRVPVLLDNDLVVWDSLAIAEYLAERFPEKRLWPEDRAARARARAACAEMHAGFAHFRAQMPMNFKATFPGRGWSVRVQKEIDRILVIWQDARDRYGAGGPFLFGAFSIADAYFAPVASRFRTYAVELPSVAEAWVQTVLGLPAIEEWAAASRAAQDFCEEDELYRLAPR
jgi:glutathione S-transferase